MKIIWSEFAVDELKSIYYYYKVNVGFYVAQQIKNEVLESVKLLKKQPRIG